MISERTIRQIHLPLFGLLTIASLIELAIAASLVNHYNGVGYPFGVTGTDRIRIMLVAGVWLSAAGLFLTIGMLLAAGTRIVGVLVHLFLTTIGFVLILIGTSTLQAMIEHTDCGTANFSRCDILKGLRVIGWIDVVICFVCLLLVIFVSFAVRGNGLVKASMVDA